MELKVTFLIVCLWALAVTSTEAGIPKCCIKTKRKIPFQMMLKVQGWTVQQSSGACDISALKLQVKGMTKPVCVHPKVMTDLIMLQHRLKHNKRRKTY